MEIRSIQRTGKMHYVYLPTSWCKQNKITSDTKVTLEPGPKNSLIVSPDLQTKTQPTIDLTLPAKYKDVLINLIMACYVNPTAAFKIRLDKKIDMASMLDQKNIVSALEFVEIDGDHISYEASMSVNEPELLLNTMLKKVKNLFYVMLESNSTSLIQKYEEEIDRSKILIQKSVISTLTQNNSQNPADLYFIAQIATELERLVDTALLVDKKNHNYLKNVAKCLDTLKQLLESQNLTYLEGAKFAHQVYALPDKDDFPTMRVKKLLQSIIELIFDWAISKEVRK